MRGGKTQAMRNWVSDKFGRNRVRTRPATTAPGPAPMADRPIQPLTGGMLYSSSISTYMTYTIRGTWPSGYWVEYEPAPPAYPDALRLPDGL